MKLSKESQYGLIATMHLARQPPGAIVNVADIADATGIAFPFLAKICNRLARAGVLRAHRGRSRGYELAQPATALTVRAVIEALEGPGIFRHCLFWSDACSESNPCVMHGLWARVRPGFVDLLEATSIDELAKRRPDMEGVVSAGGTLTQVVALIRAEP